MGLLNFKPKMSIDEFCTSFYEKAVFNVIIAGKDAAAMFRDTVYELVVEEDETFSAVGRKLFHRELIALHIELFALAWFHHFKKDEYTLPQSFFTKRYLQENGHEDIWDIMENYNKTIAHSTVEIYTDERRRTAWAAVVDSYKFNWSVKWLDEGGKDTPDMDCAGRVANRFCSEQAWKEKVTLQMLGSTLAMRLGCNPTIKPTAVFNLQVAGYGFYNGAKDAIGEVRIYAPNKTS